MELVPLFQALADSTRFAVFQCIRGCGGNVTFDDSGQLVACCEVRCVVPCAPSTLTHHLNVLRAAGLIETVRRGRETYARVNPEALVFIATFATTLEGVPCANPISSRKEVST